MNTTRTAARPLEATRTREAPRAERHFHAAGYRFDYGYLPEDFDSSQVQEANGYYRFTVLVDDRDPNATQS